jgi:hypothetical protein
LLDTLVTHLKIALYIQRTELYLEGHKPIVELTFPASHQPSMQYGGGINVAPIFVAYHSFEREAQCSPSPIYRFMCRWRAFEAIGPMRQSLHEIAENIHCTTKMPRPTPLTNDDRSAMRLSGAQFDKAKTLEDVARCFQDLRNAVVHFLTGPEKGAVVPFRALDVSVCEMASQIVAYCNERVVRPLARFYQQHLSSAMARGSILSFPGQEKEYCACEEALHMYPVIATVGGTGEPGKGEVAGDP